MAGDNPDEAEIERPYAVEEFVGYPLHDMRYLTKDSTWMNDPDNGEKLLALWTPRTCTARTSERT